jgi:DNA-binding CsgD family transcriptional regulator
MSRIEDLLVCLTTRECDCVEQVAYGGTNRQVADVLFCTESNVKWHLGNVYEKLGVSTRAELIALYWRTVLRDVEQDRDDALDALAGATAALEDS